MRMTKTLWPLCVAAVALGLSGCGGGSDTLPMPGDEGMMMPPADDDMGDVGDVVDVVEESQLRSLDGDAAEAFGAALGVHASAIDADTPPSEAADSPTRGTVVVMRPGTGAATVTVTDLGVDGNADGDEEDMDIELPMVGTRDVDGWRETVFEGETAKTADVMSETHVAVYTNIPAPTETPFGGTADEFAAGDALYELNADSDATDTDTANDALTVVFDNHGSLIELQEMLTPGTDRTYSMGDTLDGTLHGAPGTFMCNTTPCSVETDEDGELDALTSWIFVPAPNAMAMVAAMDYLTFGYWTTEAEDGTTFQVFATGMMEYTESAIENVVGTAEYAGLAAGGYERNVFAPNGTKTTTAGGFTAGVSLTANFGGEMVNRANRFTIGGDIGKFMDADGNLLAGWDVELQTADFSGRTGDDACSNNDCGSPGDSHANSFNGTTEGHEDMMGTWRGMFYGPATDDDDDAIAPSGVAGDFTGNFSNGSVVGAFGATR